MHHKITFLSALLLTLFFVAGKQANAQHLDTLKRKDSIPAEKVDSLIKVQNSPHKAAIRSAIIPGWGQVYNKKYWKVPIIYAALGITAYVFANNINTYKDLRFAYSAKYKTTLNPPDSSDYPYIKKEYQPLSLQALKEGRDTYRRYIDYSVVFFIIFWGLNIVDAAVDAHLKAFDISPDLSLKVRPNYNPLTRTGGVSLVFNFKH
jgi:hypothetical protein